MMKLKLLFADLKQHQRFFFLLGLLNFFSLFALYLVIGFDELIQERFRGESKVLLGADVEFSARRLISPDEKNSIFETLAGKYAKASEEIVMLSNVSTAQDQNPGLFNVKWISPGFPFYQKIKLSLDSRPWDFIHLHPAIFLYIEAKTTLGLKVGDTVTLLGKAFEVAGFIEEDLAASYRFLNFFPVIYVSKNFFAEEILKEAGNSFTHQLHFLWNQEIEASYSSELEAQLYELLEKKLPDPTLRISFPKQANEQNSQVFRQVSDYLSLVVFICFLLGQLGALYQIRSFLTSRTKDWALATLSGLRRRDWSIMALLFGLLPSLIAAPLALIAALNLLSILPKFFPIPSMELWKLFYLSQSSFLGLTLIAIIFQLTLYVIPIYRMYHARLLDDLLGRAPVLTSAQQRKEWMLVFLSIFCGYIFTFILTRSWALSTIVLASLLTLTIFIWATAGQWLAWRQRKLTKRGIVPAAPWLFLYLAMRGLQFRRSMTLTFFSIFTVGVTLLFLLKILDHSITTELSVDKNDAGLFIFDVNPKDKNLLEDLAKKNQIELENFSPLIRAKLISIKGELIERKVDDEQFSSKLKGLREREEEKRFLFRSINLTIRPELSAYERILSGDPLPTKVNWNPQLPIPVSLERRYAKRLGVKVGDELSFDVQGLEVKAKVVNFRSVKWLGLRPNFFITLPHGVLDDAPMTYLVVSRKSNEENERAFAKSMTKELKSVAHVKLNGVLEQAKRISQLLVDALTLLGLFTVSMAFLVVSALVGERMQEAKKEARVYFLAGLSLKKIRLLFFFEIILLTIVSLLIAAAAALGLGKFLAYEAFDGLMHIPWQTLGTVAAILFVISLALYMISLSQLSLKLRD
jgi:putative ABC transport system permease protein